MTWSHCTFKRGRQQALGKESGLDKMRSRMISEACFHRDDDSLDWSDGAGRGDKWCIGGYLLYTNIYLFFIFSHQHHRSVTNWHPIEDYVWVCLCMPACVHTYTWKTQTVQWYNSVVFSIFTELWNPHHYLILDYFHYPPKRNLIPFDRNFPISLPSPFHLWQPPIYLLSLLFSLF